MHTHSGNTENREMSIEEEESFLLAPTGWKADVGGCCANSQSLYSWAVSLPFKGGPLKCEQLGDGCVMAWGCGVKGSAFS